MGGGGTVTHARIWALVAQAIGQLRWFLLPRGTVRAWSASHGLRYTTFFGGDGRHAVGFFNPWLACVRAGLRRARWPRAQRRPAASGGEIAWPT